MQDDALSTDVDPFGHVLHLSNPSVAEYVPAKQSLHPQCSVALFMYCPAGQELQDSACVLEYVLEGQFEHFNALGGRYVPLSQEVQAAERAAEYDPGQHGEHSVAPSSV